jgi:hypothetical protein
LPAANRTVYDACDTFSSGFEILVIDYAELVSDPEGERALVLAGAAKLRFADECEARLLRPGDWLDITPHRRHRVDWSDPATPTVWLAVFYR